MAEWRRFERLLALFLLALGLGFALWHLEFLDGRRWSRALGNLGPFAGSFLPPDFSTAGELGTALLETLEMAFVGTLIGFLISLPLAVLGARNLFPVWVTAPVRLLLSVVRTVPSLVWALIFVVMVGLGPLAGTLGLALYTVGYLGKLYYEAFEGVDREVLEAVRATGASRWQRIRWAVFPEAMNPLLSQALFMLEYNVRASAILGFVGAGGIGFYMLGYVQLLQFHRLTAAILLTLVLVLALDLLSAVLRRRYLGDAPGAGPGGTFILWKKPLNPQAR
ncbi:MAG TPA: phosphonate ABC transporter, permease protein PhnE [Thermoplasmata archaeon]|nr:phosphonate ABC transporter, permease protein PhnE [Thermoplasmata archaeon]